MKVSRASGNWMPRVLVTGLPGLCAVLALSFTVYGQESIVATDAPPLAQPRAELRDVRVTPVLWQDESAPPTAPPTELPAPTDIQPSVVDGGSATNQPPAQPRPRTSPRRASTTSQFALGGAASAVSTRQASTPYMIGDLFGAAVYPITIQAPAIATNAIYIDAGADISFIFSHPGGGAAGLPPLNFQGNLGAGFDASGDGEVDTFPGLTEPGGLAAILLAAQGQPGTIVFVDGAAVLVDQTVLSTFPALNPDTAINGNSRPAVDGDVGSSFLVDAYDITYNYQFTPQRILINVPSPGGGGAVGRIKIAENNSPIPRDRVFFSYSLFHNVPLTSRDPDVNRYTPGFEKTFWQGRGSFEFRAPFASTLDSNLSTDALSNGSNTEFGNMTGILKLLFMVNDNWAFAGGLGLGIPTADDVSLSTPAGQPLIIIDNDAFHVMPYLALLWTPSDRLFAQGFVEVDVDLDGNPVYADLLGTGLTGWGRLQDSTLMVSDLGIGYWIYRGRAGQRVTGVAPVCELHYNRELNEQTVLSQGAFTIGQPDREVDVLNTTIGLNVELFGRALLTAGYTAPLSSDTDKQFDGELRVMCNIGPRPTRAARAQF